METDFELEQEISEHPWDPAQADPLQTANPMEMRGRPKLPELWTRVISVHHDDLTAIECIVIANDQKRSKKNPPSSTVGHITGQWQPLFHPRRFALENPMMSLQQFQLSNEELKEQAELVT